MQLDKTAIAISRRNLDELFDLSLAVFRKYGLMLVRPAIMGVLPFFILNALLLWSQTTIGNAISQPQEWTHLQFVISMTLLVYVESPMAMAGVTMVLGNTMFGISSTTPESIGTLRKQALPVLWVLGFIRGIIPLICYVACLELLSINRQFTETIGFFWFCLISLLIIAIRSMRPFAPEILLLEKCPLRTPKSTGSKQAITYATRSSRLHGTGGELLAITLSAGLVASGFLLILNLVSTFLIGSIVGTWTWGWWMDLFFYPTSLWIASFWGTIVRFLVYMNMRIRGEGWELELRLKAEAKRIRDAKERSHV